MVERAMPKTTFEPDPVPYVISRQTSAWATDTPISHPEPPSKEQPILVGFGGIGFTSGGFAHDLTEAQLEEIFTPMYAPEGFDG